MPPAAHPASALSGLPFEEHDASFPPSPSHSPDSELWADEDDLLQLPEFNPELERLCDPLFPSPHKFNLMMQDYLRNLSPKKREKALLTQKMYDAVLAVLQDPKNTSTKTAQFRFWAKKMFQLTAFGGEKVVCHDHKPVAVKEQIYEVLCHCHGQAGHGGRDKTSAQVRRYYSWIPKEIIARFVRDCPFCQSRRTQSTAGLSSMSESQAFLISLQSCDAQSTSSKRSVSLAQARANAAALGHKPYRRPSLRPIEISLGARSRRGSAVSLCDDEYVHYTDDAPPPPLPLSATSASGTGIGYGYEASGGTLGVPGLAVQDSYDDGFSHLDLDQSSTGVKDEGMGMGMGYAPYSAVAAAASASTTIIAPIPRRASSYHDSSSLLSVRPAEAMYRRNSESDITFGLSNMLYAEPDSSVGGANQYLSVPGVGMFNPTSMGVGTAPAPLQRSASASCLPTLSSVGAGSGAGTSETMAHFRQYAETTRIDPQLQFQAATAASASFSGPQVQIDPIFMEYRNSSASSTMSALPSEAVTPIEGHFPLSVQMDQMDISSYFPPYGVSVSFPQTQAQDQGGDQDQVSYFQTLGGGYQFPATTSAFERMATAQQQVTNLWQPDFSFGVSDGTTSATVPSAAVADSSEEDERGGGQGQGEDAATAEAVAMVQRMFDCNDIFALGQPEHTAQTPHPHLGQLGDSGQVAQVGPSTQGEMLDIDPALLDDLQNQMNMFDLSNLDSLPTSYPSVAVAEAGQGAGAGGTGHFDLAQGQCAQIIVTHPSMSLFDPAHTELHYSGMGVGMGATHQVEYSIDSQFQDHHSVYSHAHAQAQSMSLGQGQGQEENDDSPLDPLLQVMMNDDMFGYTVAVSSDPAMGNTMPGTVSMDGMSMSMVAQQEIDFSNWAGFAVS